MGAENIVQNGVEFEIPGDRKRVFKLGWKAQAWLAKKHGTIKKVYAKFSGEIDNEGNPVTIIDKDDMTECQLDACVDIIYAGLMRDAEKNGETLTRDKVTDLLDDYGLGGFMKIISGAMADALPEDDGSGDPTPGQA
jgi:hypothetical protein